MTKFGHLPKGIIRERIARTYAHVGLRKSGALIWIGNEALPAQSVVARVHLVVRRAFSVGGAATNLAPQTVKANKLVSISSGVNLFLALDGDRIGIEKTRQPIDTVLQRRSN